MRFDILTIFPEIFSSYFDESILKRAQTKKKISIYTHDIRKCSTDKHNSVDDSPYGGGPGMVMMAEPIYKTLKKVRKRKKNRIILLSAKGKVWDQESAKNYAKKYDQLILICGRYEGVDQRIENFIDEEISIGDYVLTGGELGAMILVDSISRLIPGVLGAKESSLDDSHSKKGYLEYPHYTRPQILKINKKEYFVPEVLLSGNHKKIQEWRKKQSKFK